MQRKNLQKAIIFSLILSSNIYSMALAAESFQIVDNDTLVINEAVGQVNGDELHRADKFKYGAKYFADYDNITIYAHDQKAIRSDSLNLNAPKMNLTVNVTGSKDNLDGISLYSWGPKLVLNSYKAIINSPISDALNTDFRATAINVKINDLKADVYQGHGIRANAHAGGFAGQINTLTIDNSAEINIYADASGNILNPTAVYAGDCANYYAGEWFGFPIEFGNKSTGKGVVNLNGSSLIKLSGKGNYGIWAGKNGEIIVNNVEINAEKKESFGLAATNGNITYGFDSSENKYGSKIIMTGNSNFINMAEGSKAIYADSRYSVIKSGADGIGHLKAAGDIAAKNSGTIDLSLRDWGDITGNIQAVNDAVVKLGVTEKHSGSGMTSDAAGAINIKGNVQAANGAAIALSLGNGAFFAGRTDDYQDAESNLWSSSGHSSLFDHAFVKDNNVTKSGRVNLTLGHNSVWDVTEQSWATKVSVNNSLIDLTKGAGENHAVHIGTLEGSATFIVNLDPAAKAAVNHGNMIYVHDGTRAKNLSLLIKNESDVLVGLADGQKLRFATVADAGYGFGDTYVVKGRGVINSGFSIQYENYDPNNKEENDKYNGKEFSKAKPGSNYVDSIYENGKNIYLVRDISKDAGKSDSGAAVINMSHANYKNAVYMDRLNKRLGEARYINSGEDQGVWVRLRHDRTGKSGEFRSMNTMYEIGYDALQPADSGKRRAGMVIDYMKGRTGYSNIWGKGDTSRYGLWLYDSWRGENGHYTDYIAKWGRLSNDFNIRDKDSLEQITGDYSNNVYSISAEYGRKKDIGNDWYFEPQAQLQYARVTGASYTTSQGTEVDLEAINSLIARAGFRLGKDLSERSTVYFKADVLHEFLGDQDIYAKDKTGSMDVTYGNEGTWCDVGFGFAAAMSKTSYAYLDFEKSFGNDNDETYQINAGMQWSF